MQAGAMSIIADKAGSGMDPTLLSLLPAMPSSLRLPHTSAFLPFHAHTVFPKPRDGL